MNRHRVAPANDKASGGSFFFAPAAGERVELLDQRAKRLSTCLCFERWILFDFSGVLRQRLILDVVAQPIRIIAATQMMQPGGIVDSVGQIQEHD